MSTCSCFGFIHIYLFAVSAIVALKFFSLCERIIFSHQKNFIKPHWPDDPSLKSLLDFSSQFLHFSVTFSRLFHLHPIPLFIYFNLISISVSVSFSKFLEYQFLFIIRFHFQFLSHFSFHFRFQSHLFYFSHINSFLSPSLFLLFLK